MDANPDLDSPGGRLPDDLVSLILARLPLKPLFRCRSVCKFFCGLPSDPHFARLHRRASPEEAAVVVDLRDTFSGTPALACVDARGGLAQLSLGFLNDRVRVRASCGGLLCCASVPNRGVYYVCNPVTREFRPLPRTRGIPPNRYHPDDEATLVGLAADSAETGGRFCVVLAGCHRPFGHRPLGRMVCLVYDSKLGAWRRLFISHRWDEFSRMNTIQAVFAGGSLHWLTRSCSYLLVFDLGSDVWRRIALPEEAAAGAAGAGRVYLLELQGSVSVVQLSEAWMCTWVLEDHQKEKWALVDRVHLRCIMGFTPSAFPVGQTRDVVFLATQSKILTYHRRNKVWKEVFAVKGASCSYPLWFSAHAFRGTLFSLNQGLEGLG